MWRSLLLSSVDHVIPIKKNAITGENETKPAFEREREEERERGGEGGRERASERERCYAISNQAFSGSTTEQQQYVCTNAKCSESPEKVETRLGPAVHSFNMHTPGEFAVNVNTQILVLPNLVDGLFTDNHRQMRTN